jgi:hypothetical protein
LRSSLSCDPSPTTLLVENPKHESI